jgi:predicted metal-dependent hydrolase
VQDPNFARGAALYAAGAYWEAHEEWERLWRATDDPQVRLFVQALIQVAAALHKLFVKRDAASAARLFVRAVAKLEQVPGVLRKVNVARFRDAATACRDLLEHPRQRGEDHRLEHAQDCGSLVAQRLPRIEYT